MKIFMIGFTFVGKILLLVSGGCAALALLLVVLCLIYIIADSLFDLVTKRLAIQWKKKKYVPKNKLGKVILLHHRQLDK